MKEYTIQRVDWRPDWSKIPVLCIDQSYRQSPEDIHAFAQICYHADAILVHLWAEEPRIRAVEKGTLGMPCEDSCLEFFFRPVSGDPRYFNFEFNPNGCLYLGMGRSIYDLTRLVPNHGTELFYPEINRLEDGWEIFFQIPCVFIQRFFPNFFIGPKKSIWANCYKCADLTDPPHYYSWNPIESDEFTFHCPNSFGLMRFE